MSDTHYYAVVKKTGAYGKDGAVWHQMCVSEFSQSTIKKWFSLGEIERSELEGKTCSYCLQGWTD